MKSHSINDIKKNLEKKDSSVLLGYCLRLAKYKKENKELIGFLLFEQEDISEFVESIKHETEELFAKINKTNVYYIKKSIRKILKEVNKQIRFSMTKQVEAELLIHFCNCIHSHSIPIHQSQQLLNLYNTQLKKIDSALSELHPDLQYDLKRQLKKS